MNSTDDIKNLGTIMCVGAHPDDETFMAGGLLAAAVKNGQKVICVTATKGEGGVQDESRWPAARLGEIREEELSNALRELGVSRHHWLDCTDGACDQVSDQEGAHRIKELIDTYQPATILTFGSDGLTGHPDHRAISRWATLAAQGTNAQVYYAVLSKETYDSHLSKIDQQLNYFFNIDKPPIFEADTCDFALTLSPELCMNKIAALKAMPSQYDALFQKFPEPFVQAAFSVECFQKA